MDASKPILQLHLSRHCNLACRHCYSTSGPREKQRLELPEGFFEEAYRCGIRIVSISGGEPFLDPNLRNHVQLARQAGLGVNMVSNGMLVTDEWASWVAEHIDLIAVSIDGPPPLHDRIRLKEGAFDAAFAGLRRLRDHNAPVAVIHTATMESLAHLRWLVELLQSEGIRLLQLHPLEETGRATTEFVGGAKADLPSRVAYLAQLIAPARGLTIHVDAISRRDIGEMLSMLPDQSVNTVSFLSPLVVEPDGRIVPWTYGIVPSLTIGNVADGTLTELLERYSNEKLSAAREYHHAVAERTHRQSEWPFANWYAELARHALLPASS